MSKTKLYPPFTFTPEGQTLAQLVSLNDFTQYLCDESYRATEEGTEQFCFCFFFFFCEGAQ